jgi:putative ABC transport system permease protein
VGFAVYAVILGVAFVIVREQTGVVLQVFKPDQALWLTPLGMVALGALAGLLPAIKAYRTDVAGNLTPTS